MHTRVLAMVKPILALSLLLAAPALSERVSAPTPIELQSMKASVKNLEDLVAEHEERLKVHKAENDALRNKVKVLEARIAVLEGEE